MRRRFLLALTLTIAVYGFAGWVYIALIALVHPETLPMQLTHFVDWPREDTFGAVCFLASGVSFFCYRLLRQR